jgi:putative Holliday junction resolvase
MPACLGLDYGLRRIGVAACGPDAPVALALGTHVEGRDGSIFTYLENLITSRGIEIVVVGLPLSTAGEETALSRRARYFAARLAARFPVEVVLWDERYSSREADRWLAAGRTTREDRDAVAAAIILQNYLDRRAADAGETT